MAKAKRKRKSHIATGETPMQLRRRMQRKHGKSKSPSERIFKSLFK